MKDTFYFSHDVNARSDPKLIKVQMMHGMTGIGIYWCIVEMLYENSGFILPEYDRITFELRNDETVIKSIINDFGLFEIMDGKITSQAVLRQINFRIDKSVKAKESIAKRWDKYDSNTIVLQSNEDRNTKERKGEDRKEKDRKGERENARASFEFLFSEMTSDSEWVNRAKIATNINGNFDATLRKFLTELAARNRISDNPDILDIQAHFISWVKKGNQTHPQTTQTTKTTTDEEAAARIARGW